MQSQELLLDLINNVIRKTLECNIVFIYFLLKINYALPSDGTVILLVTYEANKGQQMVRSEALVCVLKLYDKGLRLYA